VPLTPLLPLNLQLLSTSCCCCCPHCCWRHWAKRETFSAENINYVIGESGKQFKVAGVARLCGEEKTEKENFSSSLCATCLLTAYPSIHLSIYPSIQPSIQTANQLHYRVQTECVCVCVCVCMLCSVCANFLFCFLRRHVIKLSNYSSASCPSLFLLYPIPSHPIPSRSVPLPSTSPWLWGSSVSFV